MPCPTVEWRATSFATSNAGDNALGLLEMRLSLD